MWTEDDVEYALNWQAIDRENCSGCGQPRHESFDPANEDAYEVKALACHACAARERRAKSMQTGEGSSPDGLFFSVTKVRERP